MSYENLIECMIEYSSLGKLNPDTIAYNDKEELAKIGCSS